MGLNLANLLMGSLANDSSLNALAGKTGLSTKNLSKLLTAALPMLIKFLTSNAGSAEGAQSLLGALGGHKDTRAMADQIKDADADDGKRSSDIFWAVKVKRCSASWLRKQICSPNRLAQHFPTLHRQ